MFQLRVLDGVGQHTSRSTHAYWWQLHGSASWSEQSQVAERFVCQHHRQTVRRWRSSNETTAVQMHFARSASVLYRCTEHTSRHDELKYSLCGERTANAGGVCAWMYERAKRRVADPAHAAHPPTQRHHHHHVRLLAQLTKTQQRVRGLNLRRFKKFIMQ